MVCTLFDFMNLLMSVRYIFFECIPHVSAGDTPPSTFHILTVSHLHLKSTENNMGAEQASKVTAQNEEGGQELWIQNLTKRNKHKNRL